MSALRRTLTLALLAMVTSAAVFVYIKAQGVAPSAARTLLGPSQYTESLAGNVQALARAWSDAIRRGYAVEIQAEASTRWPASPELAALLKAHRPQDIWYDMSASCSGAAPAYELRALQVAPSLSVDMVSQAWLRSLTAAGADPALVRQVVRFQELREQGGKAASAETVPRKLGAFPVLAAFEGGEDMRPALMKAWPELAVGCEPASSPVPLARLLGARAGTKALTPAALGLGKATSSRASPTGTGQALVMSQEGIGAGIYEELAAKFSRTLRPVHGARKIAEGQLYQSVSWETQEGELRLERRTSLDVHKRVDIQLSLQPRTN